MTKVNCYDISCKYWSKKGKCMAKEITLNTSGNGHKCQTYELDKEVEAVEKAFMSYCKTRGLML